MDTNQITVGDVVVIELLGETVDAAVADDVKGQLSYLATEHPKLVVDIHQVRFLDSAGCGALVTAQRRFQEAGGDMRVCSPTPEVKTLLELARLTRILAVYDTRAEAVAAFGR